MRVGISSECTGLAFARGGVTEKEYAAVKMKCVRADAMRCDGRMCV